MVNPDCDECFGDGYITLWPYAQDPWNHKPTVVPCPLCNAEQKNEKEKD